MIPKKISRPAFLQILSILLMSFLMTLPAHASRPLEVRGEKNNPPFDFLNDMNAPDGFNVDIIKAVSQKMGLAINIQMDFWQKIRKELEQGKIDILTGMYRTEERDKLVDFSIPHFVTSYTLFVPKNSSITSLTQTHNKTIAVQENDFGHDYLREHDITDTILPSKSITSALEDLAAGRADCAFLPRLQGMIGIHEKKLHNLEPVGNRILTNKFCIAVPEGHTELLATLNEGLSILKYSGEYDRIYNKWFGLYQTHEPNYQNFFTYVIMVLVIMSGIIALILLWTWLLKRNVRHKTKQLWENRENLEITLNSIADAVITTNAQGIVTRMNPVAEELTGWTITEAQGQPVEHVLQVIHSLTKKPIPNPAIQALTSGKPSVLSHNSNLISKNGTEFHISHSAAPIRDATEKIQGAVMIFRDVTEKHQMLKTLLQNEERFQRAMEASKDGLWDWNITTDETYYSPGYGKILGYSENEMPALVNSWKELLHPDDQEETLRANQECIENKHDEFTIKYRMRGKNGEWHWILARGKAILRDTNGQAVRLVGTHTDITRLKQIEEALVRQNNRYFTLLKNLNGMVYRCKNDEHWTMLFVSEGCYTLTGYPADDLLKNKEMAFNDLILSGYRTSLWETWQKAITNHEPVEVEYEIKTASGQTKWVWEKGRGIFDNEGNLIHLEGFITDISERKQMEKVLEKRLVALTRPLGDTKNITFEELFNLDDIQQIQDEFAKAVGIASMICAPDGTPITRPSNFCRLCKDIIRQTEQGCADCHRSDIRLGRLSTDGPIIKPCLGCGIWDAGASISIEGKHIATWMVGQVRDETQTEETIRAYAKKIGVDPEAAVRAFYEVPTMTHKKFKQIAQTIYTLANQLSLSAYQNIQQARFITERNQALDKLHRNEENLRVTLASIGDGVIATDIQGNVTLMNPVAENLTGWSRTEAEGKPLETIFNIVQPQTRQPAENPLEKILATGAIIDLADHTILIARDGKEYQIADSGAPILSDTGTPLGVVLVFRDVTEEYALQEQLHQSQKMDAIGQLAGGVAHDFNNMLSGIMGAAELLKLQHTEKNNTTSRHIDLILQAASRASDLTSKLLAFGRKKNMTSTVVNIHEIVNDTAAILGSVLDKKIEISLALDAECFSVRGDTSALQNALMNMGINAGHAMPAGGKLRIETHTRDVDTTYCAASTFTMEPGQYIEITIRDTGTGITQTDLPRIFEPFYTTKKPGKGTGLGLAAVYGTVQDHHGEVTVTSKENVGTSFQIFLPCTDELPLPSQNDEETMRGSGQILLVDDEECIRTTGELLLEEEGYQVLLAANGREAVDIFREKYTEIDAVIMDMLMPELDGDAALIEMKKIDKECKVIIASGFMDDHKRDALYAAGVAGYLHKPYKIAKLTRLLADILANNEHPQS